MQENFKFILVAYRLSEARNSKFVRISVHYTFMYRTDKNDVFLLH